MRTYLINLDRSPERLARMDRILGELGLDYERVPAIDGLALPEAEICRHNEVALQPLSAGEIGCFLSHRAAWMRMVEAGLPHALILEDDLHFSEAARSFLAREDWIPGDADIVKIETTGRRTVLGRTGIAIGTGHSLSVLRGKHYCTGGYVISLACARRLVEEHASIPMPVDEFLFNPESLLFGSLRVYQMVPALCIQAVMHSGIRSPAFLASQIAAGRAEAKPRFSRQEKAKREALRIVGQARGWIAAHRLNIFSDRIKVRVDFGCERHHSR